MKLIDIINEIKLNRNSKIHVVPVGEHGDFYNIIDGFDFNQEDYEQGIEGYFDDGNFVISIATGFYEDEGWSEFPEEAEMFGQYLKSKGIKYEAVEREEEESDRIVDFYIPEEYIQIENKINEIEIVGKKSPEDVIELIDELLNIKNSFYDNEGGDERYYDIEYKLNSIGKKYGIGPISSRSDDHWLEIFDYYLNPSRVKDLWIDLNSLLKDIESDNDVLDEIKLFKSDNKLKLTQYNKPIDDKWRIEVPPSENFPNSMGSIHPAVFEVPFDKNNYWVYEWEPGKITEYLDNLDIPYGEDDFEGEPYITIPKIYTVKVENIRESYKEEKNSTFTHNGKEYSINKLFNELTLPEKVKVSKLKWILKNSKLDKDRINKADLSYPIIITKWNNKLVVLDGVHRLKKALDKGLTDIMAITVDRNELNKAKLKNG